MCSVEEARFELTLGLETGVGLGFGVCGGRVQKAGRLRARQVGEEEGRHAGPERQRVLLTFQASCEYEHTGVSVCCMQSASALLHMREP